MFSDQQSNLTIFLVGVGTFPGSADTSGSWHRITDASSPGATQHTFQGLKLASSTRYYVTVHALNGASLSAYASSDGVQMDTTGPLAGYVRHGGATGHSPFHPGGDAVVHANWNGFVDYESAVIGYEWALATEPGLDDLLPFAAVGLATTAVSAQPLQAIVSDDITLFHITVRATNGNGATTVTSSAAVRVDRSGPAGYACASTNTNLIQNGDFESASDDAPWDIGDASSLASGPAEQAYTGSTFLRLRDSIRQKVTGLSTGAEYRLLFHARHLGSTFEDAVELTLDQGGDDGEQTRAFPVRVTEGAQAWQRFSLAFVAAGSDVGVLFQAPAASRTAGLGLDGVELALCTRVSAGAGDVFAADHHFFSSTDHIRMAWAVEDRESGIHSFIWAVGTVPGGQQISEYTDIGTSASAETSGLNMAHGTALYFSVAAKNRAGERSDTRCQADAVLSGAVLSRFRILHMCSLVCHCEAPTPLLFSVAFYSCSLRKLYGARCIGVSIGIPTLLIRAVPHRPTVGVHLDVAYRCGLITPGCARRA